MSRSSISSSEADSPWRFLARVAVCGAPFLALALGLESVLWRTGESWPVARVAALQRNASESLFARGVLSQQLGLYKHARLRDVRAEIVVVGSSRVMQIPARLFETTGMTLFNAGGMIQGVGDLERYAADIAVGRLPSPRVVILGVDPWWLFGDRARTISAPTSEDVALNGAAHVVALRRWMYGREFPFRAIRVGALGPGPSGTRGAIGIGALQYGTGFRVDGSRQYPPAYYDELRRTGRYRDREDPPVIERIRSFRGQFVRNAGIRGEAVDRLIAACARIRNAGVEVIVYLPPFADECRVALDTSTGHAAWWGTYQRDVPVALSRAGFPCRASESPRDYDLDDRWMFDGFHPGEVLNAYVLARSLAFTGGLLSDQTDLEAVRALAGRATLQVTLPFPKRER